jgi:hypothetical protein
MSPALTEELLKSSTVVREQSGPFSLSFREVGYGYRTGRTFGYSVLLHQLVPFIIVCSSHYAFRQSVTFATPQLYKAVPVASNSQIPNNLPASLTGNVMLDPCSGSYGDPLGAADPLGVQRGILFFQDRSVLSANQSWSGSFLLAGMMYFHSCNAAGTGTACGTAGTYYNDMFTLHGSGSSTNVLGDIIADNITLGGNSSITMDLNPTKAFTILKTSLLQ